MKAFLVNYRTSVAKLKSKAIEKIELENINFLIIILIFLLLEDINKEKLDPYFKEIYEDLENLNFYAVKSNLKILILTKVM